MEIQTLLGLILQILKYLVFFTKDTITKQTYPTDLFTSAKYPQLTNTGATLHGKITVEQANWIETTTGVGIPILRQRNQRKLPLENSQVETFQVTITLQIFYWPLTEIM